MMKITKHGQSCLLIETNGKKILVDPGIYAFGEEHEGLVAADFADIDIIVVTHEHQDHFYLPAILEILKMGSAEFLGTQAACEQLRAELPDAACMRLEDGFNKKYDNIVFTGFGSIHGPLPNGSVPPQVCGIVIDDGETRIYLPGDTTELNKNVRDIDIAFVPICGEVVMTIAEAKAEMLKLMPKIAIPYHYDNPRFPVNAEDFISAMAGTGIPSMTMVNGQCIEM